LGINLEELWRCAIESVADVFASNFYFGHMFSSDGTSIYIQKIPQENKTSIAIYRQFFEKSGGILKQTNYGG